MKRIKAVPTRWGWCQTHYGSRIRQGTHAALLPSIQHTAGAVPFMSWSPGLLKTSIRLPCEITAHKIWPPKTQSTDRSVISNWELKKCKLGTQGLLNFIKLAKTNKTKTQNPEHLNLWWFDETSTLTNCPWHSLIQSCIHSLKNVLKVSQWALKPHLHWLLLLSQLGTDEVHSFYCCFSPSETALVLLCLSLTRAQRVKPLPFFPHTQHWALIRPIVSKIFLLVSYFLIEELLVASWLPYT